MSFCREGAIRGYSSERQAPGASVKKILVWYMTHDVMSVCWFDSKASRLSASMLLFFLVNDPSDILVLLS